MASIGAQVADGLAALHATGQLHGDVKPANLLRVGPDWKLGDFGVSVAVQGSYAVAPGATLDYTPPELSTESDGFRVHRSSDVWALGVTLWIAATGQHPFVGAAPFTRLAAALRGERAPAEIDPRLAELIDRRCLVHDPRSRAGAAELAERLGRLAGEISRPAVRPLPAGAGGPATAAGPARVGSRTEPVRAPARSGCWPRDWRRPRLTAVVITLTSLAAAAVPVGLGGRRAVYLAADPGHAGRCRVAHCAGRGHRGSGALAVACGRRDRARRHRLPVLGQLIRRGGRPPLPAPRPPGSLAG